MFEMFEFMNDQTDDTGQNLIEHLLFGTSLPLAL